MTSRFIRIDTNIPIRAPQCRLIWYRKSVNDAVNIDRDVVFVFLVFHGASVLSLTSSKAIVIYFSVCASRFRPMHAKLAIVDCLLACETHVADRAGAAGASPNKSPISSSTSFGSVGSCLGTGATGGTGAIGLCQLL